MPRQAGQGRQHGGIVEDADRDRFSFVGHRSLTHCNPLPDAKIEAVLDRASIGRGARALDVGCGKGAILASLVRRGAVGLGVERSLPMVEAARERLAGAPVEIRHASATETDLGQGWDVVACVGLSELFGSPERTLRALAERIAPHGWLLWGTTYWKRPPPPAYLELLGIPADAYDDYAGVVASASRAGLRTWYARVASEDDWDHYEWSYRADLSDHLAGGSEPLAEAFAERSRFLERACLLGGRDALGFGLFLLRR